MKKPAHNNYSGLQADFASLKMQIEQMNISLVNLTESVTSLDKRLEESNAISNACSKKLSNLHQIWDERTVKRSELMSLKAAFLRQKLKEQELLILLAATHKEYRQKRQAFEEILKTLRASSNS